MSDDKNKIDEINCGREICQILKKYDCEFIVNVSDFDFNNGFNFRLECKKIKS